MIHIQTYMHHPLPQHPTMVMCATRILRKKHARHAHGSLRGEEFTVRVAADVKETYELIEAGFEYVTGEYNDGGKRFRKRK